MSNSKKHKEGTSNGKKNKGGMKPWATPEQQEWLDLKHPSYLASRSSETPGDYWNPLFEEWLEKWPIEDPEQVKRRKVVSSCAH